MGFVRRFAAALLFTTGAALAAPVGIAVSPIRLDLQAPKPSASLTVSNGDSSPRRFQIEVLRWTQQDGRDVFVPADELLANPPLFELAPGARQVLRVGLLGATPRDTEAAYRVYISEVPRAEQPAAGQLRLLLRMGVPVYAVPQTGARPAWRWSARRDAGHYVIRADNSGNVHQRRQKLRVFDADSGALLGQSDNFRDVLAGAHHEWRFVARPPYASRIRLSSASDSGVDAATIPLASR